MISAEEIKALMAKDENGLLPCYDAGEYAEALSTLQTLLNQAGEALQLYAEVDNEVEKFRLGFAAKSETVCKESVAVKTFAAIEPYLTKEGE